MDDPPDQDFVEPREKFTPVRRSLNINVGAFVRATAGVYRVIQVLDFQTVIGQHVETSRSEPLRISDLRPVEEGGVSAVGDLMEIGDEDWRTAETRYAVIKPLVEAFHCTRAMVEERARESGVDKATVYRWLGRYRVHGEVSALIPAKRGWKKGSNRIPSGAEEVIKEAVRTVYLSVQKSKPQKVVAEVLRLCDERKIQPPSPSTIRTRLSRISERDQLRGRGEAEKARNKFVAKPGRFPHADYPLAVVQIDHTPCDIILVDDVHRRPIGRPWLTLAMDVNTRMVAGYYLTFDPPSFTSVGMCIAHMMLPKENWLLLHKIEAEWPVWGTPKTIHTDNGSDFRGDNLRESCLIHGIHREFRPVARPHFGGHIERLIGNFMGEVHDLPGTTFSSVAKKGEYDSEKHACMTLGEFEAWLVDLIANVYHQKIHSELGMSPIRKWNLGIFGNAEMPGVGMPARPAEPHTILLDFTEGFQRTAQAFGVTIEGITYFADSLRRWLNATMPDNPKAKRHFTFRRDPRDISAIWFADPELKQYFKVPYADMRRLPMSAWELKRIKAQLEREGVRNINQNQIFAALTRMRAHVEQTKATTKKTRREAQRRIEHERKVSPAEPQGPRERPTPAVAVAPDWRDDDFEFVGEIA